MYTNPIGGIMKTAILLTLAALSLNAGSINPEAYQKHSQVQWIWGVLSMDALELSGTEHVLDLGSGDGKLTALLASKLNNGYVLGIDPSEEFISLAQFTHQAHNLDFEVGDAQSLNFEHEFDLITAFLCLNWVSDLDSTLNGMRRALKANGQVLIVIPHTPKPELLKEWRLYFTQDKWKPYLHLFAKQYQRSQEEWENAVERNGFKIEHYQITKTPIVFHDREEMKQWIVSLNSGFDQLPVNLLEELIDFRLEMMNTWFPQAGDGRIYAFPERVEILLSPSL